MAQMEVKEAVKLAKNYIADMFEGEDISNIGLEEVDFNDAKSKWLITIGFFRPWERPGNNIFTTADMIRRNIRTYKVVYIDDTLKRVDAVKNLDMGS